MLTLPLHYIALVSGLPADLRQGYESVYPWHMLQHITKQQQSFVKLGFRGFLSFRFFNPEGSSNIFW
jgi:hypothetical protein